MSPRLCGENYLGNFLFKINGGFRLNRNTG